MNVDLDSTLVNEQALGGAVNVVTNSSESSNGDDETLTGDFSSHVFQNGDGEFNSETTTTTTGFVNGGEFQTGETTTTTGNLFGGEFQTGETTTTQEYQTGETTMTGEYQTGETTMTTQEGQMEGMTFYSKPIITQTQQVVSKPVITRRVISQPVVTRQIVSQPIIRQRIVQTPVVRRRVVKRPVYTQNINNEPIVDNQTSVRNVNVNVPGQVTYNQKIYQPSVKTIRENVNVQRGETKVVNHDEIVRPTKTETKTTTKRVTVPAKEYYTQPVHYKQVINNTEEVKFNRGEPRYETKETVTRQPQYRTTTRTQTEQRPAAHYYSQKIYQPTVERNNVEIRLNRQDDQRVVNQPVYLPVRHNHVYTDR